MLSKGASGRPLLIENQPSCFTCGISHVRGGKLDNWNIRMHFGLFTDALKAFQTQEEVDKSNHFGP